MYKRCFTEQSARRQRELEAGFLSAMAVHSYESITVIDLCSWLQIPRKSFYRYFSSKEGVLYALIDHTLMDFSGDFISSGVEASFGTLERFFSFWPNQQLLLDALARNDLSGLLIQRAIVLATTEDTFNNSLFGNYPPSAREYIIMFLVSGLMSLIIQWHKTHFKNSPHQMASIAAHLLSQPLISSERRETFLS